MAQHQSVRFYSTLISTQLTSWEKLVYIFLLLYLEFTCRQRVGLIATVTSSGSVLLPRLSEERKRRLSAESEKPTPPFGVTVEEVESEDDHFYSDLESLSDLEDHDLSSLFDQHNHSSTATSRSSSPALSSSSPSISPVPPPKSPKMEFTGEQSFNIRDLTTKSVTLYPSRAQITREIKDIHLERGLNQITVIGLSPTVDRDSIKIEGAGSAIINDISVELLPNTEHFEDIYPEESSDESDIEDPYLSDIEPSDALKDADRALRDAKIRHEIAAEGVRSSEARIRILRDYAENIPKREVGESTGFAADLETYRAERERAYQDGINAEREKREASTEVDKLTKVRDKIRHGERQRQDKIRKQRAKEAKKRAKERAEKQRRRGLKRAEKKRERDELKRFWPKQVYTVTISLEISGNSLPVPPPLSRRSSSSSVMEATVHLETASVISMSDGVGAPSLCTLLFTYMTSCAYWTPSYDLQLSTVNNTANLCVDAVLVNHTSETWKGAILTLSNSNTNFSSLDDTLPELVPWRIKLRDEMDRTPLFQPGGENLLYSAEEIKHALAWTQKKRAQEQDSVGDANGKFAHLFGGDNRFAGRTARDFDQVERLKISETGDTVVGTRGGLFGEAPPQRPVGTRGGLFGAPPPQRPVGNGSGLFGVPTPQRGAVTLSSQSEARQQAPEGASHLASSHNFTAHTRQRLQSSVDSEDLVAHIEEYVEPENMPFGTGDASPREEPAPAAAPAGGLFRPANALASVFNSASILRRAVGPAGVPGGDGAASNVVFETLQAAHDEDLLLGKTPEIEFLESTTEEAGLTTTYEIPGTKTLVPRGKETKQRIARVMFYSVQFKHTVVPKYVPVAYLTATIRNSSKMTLLRGPIGLTLDGVFLGRSKLSHCATGSPLELSLGVDPTIRVSYLKPEVRRTTGGIFTKENSAVYTRSILITNTKSDAKRPAKLTVVDQVPISQDAQLHVNVLAPQGVSADARVKTGEILRVKGAVDSDADDWGEAEATMKKGGEIEWDVVLRGGRGVKLALEYDVSMPVGEVAIRC